MAGNAGTFTFGGTYSTGGAVQEDEPLKLKSPYYERVQRLAKTLKSGQYKQCKGALKKTVDGEETFCVWGVGIDLYMNTDTEEDKQNLEWTTVQDSMSPKVSISYLKINGSTYMSAMPSAEALAHYGFNGSVRHVDFAQKLVNKNDDGVDFNGLAEIILNRIVRDDTV